MKQDLLKFIPVILITCVFHFTPSRESSSITSFSPLQDTSAKRIITKTKGYEAITTGISYSRIETYMDSIYYPKSLYYNIRFTEVMGIDVNIINTAKLTIILLNENNENLPLIKTPKKYAARTFKEGPQVNILFSIPLPPDDKNNVKRHYELILENENMKHIIVKGKIGYV